MSVMKCMSLAFAKVALCYVMSNDADGLCQRSCAFPPSQAECQLVTTMSHREGRAHYRPDCRPSSRDP